MSINETVLEMHYHKPLLDVFRTTLGLGTGAFNFYKYSPQRECFVGFDQAFVQTDLSEIDLFNKLKSSALNDNYKLKSQFVGYFLQYKVVNLMQNRLRHTPVNVTNKPHQRVILSTAKNLKTGFSQHEMLYNLNQNHKAYVYYACPMIFERAELYNDAPDLDLLRLVDVSSSPSDYSDNEKHFIYFNDIDAAPIWCSEPTDGKAITPTTFVERTVEFIRSESFHQNQIALFEMLIKPMKIEGTNEKTSYLKQLHEAFTLIEFREENDD